jgi:glycosyltransferase involved in cell wall biosynthesis
LIEDKTIASDTPSLTVVIVVGDEGTRVGFERTMQSLRHQTMIHQMEILVVDCMAWAVASGARSTLLQRAVRERAFEDRMRVLGTVPHSDLEKVMASADVLLLPYSRKPVNLARFPNRFGDFLAAGGAMVTNRTGDMGEMVAGHQLGVLAADDPLDMSRKVLGLFEDRPRDEEFGRRARALAEDHLSWEILAREVEQFYSDLLASGVH